MHKAVIAAAVALMGVASAGEVAVSTSGTSPVAFELNESTVAAAVVVPTGSTSLYAFEVTESTTTMTTTSTVWKYITVWPTTSIMSTPAIPVEQKAAASEADITTIFMLHTVTVQVIAQPIVTQYINYAGGEGQAHNLKHDTAGDKRDVVDDRDVLGIPSFITDLMTSVLPASTVFVHVTGSPSPPTTVTSFTTIQANIATPAAIPGVTTTSVTTVITVYPSNTAANSTNSNGSTSTTDSWLNISTFKYTGSANLTSWTTWPFATGPAVNASNSSHAVTATYSNTLPTSKHSTASSTAEVLPGFSAVRTATIHHNGSNSVAGKGGVLVMIFTLAAVAAGFALA